MVALCQNHSMAVAASGLRALTAASISLRFHSRSALTANPHPDPLPKGEGDQVPLKVLAALPRRARLAPRRGHVAALTRRVVAAGPSRPPARPRTPPARR